MTELVDPEVLPTERLEHELTTLAAHVSAATARWLLLVAEYDRREAWASWGARSCAQWLSVRCGIASSTAREQLRVAHALRGLPVITREFTAGRLSYSQVRSLTRMATPETDADLADLARRATGSQLERLARAFVRAAPRDGDRRRERRSFESRWDANGNLQVRVCLTPEQGAMVLAAIEAVDDAPADASSTATQRRADRLVEVIRRGIGGDGPPIPAEITVVVESDGHGHLAEGPALDDATVEALRCDNAEVVLTESAGDVLNLGRRRRLPNTAQRRAMRRRDGGCVYDGCGARRWVAAHHVDWWERDKGRTDLNVLVTLCAFHHRLVHQGNLRVEPDGEGGFRFHRGDGAPVGRADVSGRPTGAFLRHDIHAETAVPRWCGDRLDLDDALTALLN